MLSSSFATEVSHTLVVFLDEEQQPTCVMSTNRIKDSSKPREGDECQVEWSDGKVYCAKVLALGKCVYNTRTYMYVCTCVYCRDIHVHLYVVEYG